MANKTTTVEFKLKATDEASSVLGKVRNGLAELRSPKGIEETLFGGSERGIRGIIKGGALGFIGEQFDKTTEKAAELTDQFRDGQTNAQDMAAGLARSIPILGSFIKGWDNIQEIITGDQADIDRMTEGVKILDELTSQRAESLKREKELWADLGDEVAGLKDQMQGFGLEGMSAIQHGIDVTLNAARRASQKVGRDERQKLFDDANKDVADIQTQYGQGKINQDDAQAALFKVATGYNKDVADSNARQRERDLTDEQFFEAKKHEAIRQANLGALKLETDYDDEVESLRSESNQQRLKNDADSTAADIEQVRLGAEQKKHEIERHLDEQRKLLDPRKFAELQQHANEAIAGINEKEALDILEANRQGHNRTLAAQTGIDQERRQQNLESLRAEASIAGGAKEIELERAEIAEKYLEKREAINQRLREDLSLTKDQRQELTGIRDGLAAQEATEKRIVALKQFNPSLAATEGEGITGLASAFGVSIANIKGSILGAPGAAATGGPGVAGGFGVFGPKLTQNSEAQTAFLKSISDGIKLLVAANSQPTQSLFGKN